MHVQNREFKNTGFVGDMTIGYDPPRRVRVIPMAVYQDKAHEDVKMAVHEEDLLRARSPRGDLRPIGVNRHICMTCVVRQG